MRLSEQTVLVTGAGSGSGEAVVRGFRAEGASIVALGRRAGPLEALAAELPSVVASPGNLAVRADVDRAVALAQSRFGGLLDGDGGTTSLNPGRLGYKSAYRAAAGRS